VLSVLLQYTDSDYPFGIFKLFLNILPNNSNKNKTTGVTQKDKQRSTKHTYKTKDRVPRTPVIQSSIST
jgi:hypothetical protein